MVVKVLKPRVRDGRIFIHIEDLEDARRFYGDLLGLSIERARTNWIDLKPKLGLTLSSGDEEQIEFHVDNFEEAATFLEKKGLRFYARTSTEVESKTPLETSSAYTITGEAQKDENC